MAAVSRPPAIHLFSLHVIKYNWLKKLNSHMSVAKKIYIKSTSITNEMKSYVCYWKGDLFWLWSSNCTQGQFLIFTQELGQLIQFLACQTKCHWLDQTLLISQFGQGLNGEHRHEHSNLSNLSSGFTTFQLFSGTLAIDVKEKKKADVKKLANSELDHEARVWVQGIPMSNTAWGKD